jgi:hypothetical protein
MALAGLLVLLSPAGRLNDSLVLQMGQRGGPEGLAKYSLCTLVRFSLATIVL